MAIAPEIFAEPVALEVGATVEAGPGLIAALGAGAATVVAAALRVGVGWQDRGCTRQRDIKLSTVLAQDPDSITWGKIKQ